MEGKRFVSLILLVLFFSISSFAQLNNCPNSHVIVAIDNALPIGYWDFLKDREKILSTLERLLEANNCKLNTDDYVSMVTFAIGLDDKSFNNFAKPISKNGGSFCAWEPCDNLRDVLGPNNINWSETVCEARTRFTGSPYSLLSGAKQFSVYSLKQSLEDEKIIASNNIYLAVITDDHYNGQDNYSKEFESYEGMNGKASKDDFFGMIEQFNSSFNFEKVGDINLIQQYKIALYKMTPVQRPSISSVVDFPPSLNLHRIKGGYKIAFNASSDDSMYHLLKCRLEVLTVEGDSIVKEFSSSPSGECSIDLSLKYGEINPDSIKVIFKAWLLQKDGIYNGYVLNPYDKICSRLSTTINLSCPSEGRVLGIPLGDMMWWWCQDDIKMAAFIWEFIILGIVVIAVVVILYYYNKKTSVYNVENSEIVIEPFEVKKK